MQPRSCCIPHASLLSQRWIGPSSSWTGWSHIRPGSITRWQFWSRRRVSWWLEFPSLFPPVMLPTGDSFYLHLWMDITHQYWLVVRKRFSISSKSQLQSHQSYTVTCITMDLQLNTLSSSIGLFRSPHFFTQLHSHDMSITRQHTMATHLKAMCIPDNEAMHSGPQGCAFQMPNSNPCSYLGRKNGKEA